MYNFAFSPDETGLVSQVFPYSQREREREGGEGREQKRWIISTRFVICRQWRMKVVDFIYLAADRDGFQATASAEL